MTVSDSYYDEIKEAQFKKDLRYIDRDIIAPLNDGKYCKYSRELHAVSVYDLTFGRYVGYWKQVYKSSPEYLSEIVKHCRMKFDNGLISQQQMIKLVKESNDRDDEKIKVLELLGGDVFGYKRNISSPHREKFDAMMELAEESLKEVENHVSEKTNN